MNQLYDKHDFEAALKSVQWYLSKKSFLREKTTGMVQVQTSQSVDHNKYLCSLMENSAKTNHILLREAYTDESYVHHHHRSEAFILFIPTENDEVGKSSHMGRSYCFVTAIQGPERTSSDGLVPGSMRIISPSLREHRSSDYHKVFNDENPWIGLTTNYFLISPRSLWSFLITPRETP